MDSDKIETVLSNADRLYVEKYEESYEHNIEDNRHVITITTLENIQRKLGTVLVSVSTDLFENYKLDYDIKISDNKVSFLVQPKQHGKIEEMIAAYIRKRPEVWDKLNIQVEDNTIEYTVINAPNNENIIISELKNIFKHNNIIIKKYTNVICHHVFSNQDGHDLGPMTAIRVILEIESTDNKCKKTNASLHARTLDALQKNPVIPVGVFEKGVRDSPGNRLLAKFIVAYSRANNEATTEEIMDSILCANMPNLDWYIPGLSETWLDDIIEKSRSSNDNLTYWGNLWISSHFVDKIEKRCDPRYYSTFDCIFNTALILCTQNWKEWIYDIRKTIIIQSIEFEIKKMHITDRINQIHHIMIEKLIFHVIQDTIQYVKEHVHVTYNDVGDQWNDILNLFLYDNPTFHLQWPNLSQMAIEHINRITHIAKLALSSPLTINEHAFINSYKEELINEYNTYITSQKCDNSNPDHVSVCDIYTKQWESEINKLKQTMDIWVHHEKAIEDAKYLLSLSNSSLLKLQLLTYAKLTRDELETSADELVEYINTFLKTK